MTWWVFMASFVVSAAGSYLAFAAGHRRGHRIGVQQGVETGVRTVVEQLPAAVLVQLAGGAGGCPCPLCVARREAAAKARRPS